MRQEYLTADYTLSNAPSATYDTDLENFWTQSSINISYQRNIFKISIRNFSYQENFVDLGESEANADNIYVKINIQNQKFQVIFIKNIIDS